MSTPSVFESKMDIDTTKPKETAQKSTKHKPPVPLDPHNNTVPKNDADDIMNILKNLANKALKSTASTEEQYEKEIASSIIDYLKSIASTVMPSTSKTTEVSREDLRTKLREKINGKRNTRARYIKNGPSSYKLTPLDKLVLLALESEEVKKKLCSIDTSKFQVDRKMLPKLIDLLTTNIRKSGFKHFSSEMIAKTPSAKTFLETLARTAFEQYLKQKVPTKKSTKASKKSTEVPKTSETAEPSETSTLTKKSGSKETTKTEKLPVPLDV